MFSVITNIYNKKTKGPTLMEFFTATRKLKTIFWQLEMFYVPPVVHTSNISNCQKKLFQFSCGCEQFH
jgi:exonuclease I